MTLNDYGEREPDHETNNRLINRRQRGNKTKL